MNKKVPLAFIFLASLFSSANLFAQNPDNPGDYISAISSSQNEMNATYMAYMSAAAHSGRARKVEKMRQQTLESIQNCKYKLSELPIYKGDNSLRKSSMDYVDLCYKIFNEDYAHIVNMEDIAEQSVDEMQAYLLLEEKTNEKLSMAADKMDSAVKTFAAKYNVTLVDSKSELSDKMKSADQLNHYHHQLYLVFFKCYWEDGQLIDAIQQKNINTIEQARNALLAYVQDGYNALDTLQSFEGDPSLANTCKTILTAYKSIAADDVPKQEDFLLKEESFEKIKKNFDLKSAKDRTQTDVDAYNKAVNEMNSGINTYNQVNEKSNNSRNNAINNWNTIEKSFLDAHMPYYK